MWRLLLERLIARLRARRKVGMTTWTADPSQRTNLGRGDFAWSEATGLLPEGTPAGNFRARLLRTRNVGGGWRIQTDTAVRTSVFDQYLGWVDLSGTGLDLSGDWELECTPQCWANTNGGGVRLVVAGNWNPATFAMTGYGWYLSGASVSSASGHLHRYDNTHIRDLLTDKTHGFTGSTNNSVTFLLRHHAGGRLEWFVGGVLRDSFDDRGRNVCANIVGAEGLFLALENHHNAGGPEVSPGNIIVRDVHSGGGPRYTRDTLMHRDPSGVKHRYRYPDGSGLVVSRAPTPGHAGLFTVELECDAAGGGRGRLPSWCESMMPNKVLGWSDDLTLAFMTQAQVDALVAEWDGRRG